MSNPMTVGELRKLLEPYEEDETVAVAYPSRDHWRNVIAADIEEVTEGWRRESDYHQRPIVIDPDPDDDPRDDDEPVVLITLR